MAVTSLGVIGTATGSGSSLVIPITADVPACDVTTWREVFVYMAAFGYFADEPVGFSSASDDATLTDPNICYGANPYRGEQIDNGSNFIGSDLTPSGLDEAWGVGWIVAPLYQPLANGVNSITIEMFDSPYWTGAIAIAVEGSTDGQVDTIPNFAWNSNADTCPGGGSICFTPENAGPDSGFATFGLYALFQYYTTGASSLTWADAGVALEADMYDQGACHVSMAVGTQTLTPGGTYDVGGCTDDGCPDTYFSEDNTLGTLSGQLKILGDGLGLDPCVIAAVFGVNASVGDYVT
jgi:hypothetical protein